MEESSQASQSYTQAERSAVASLTEEARKNLTGKLAVYLLINDQKKLPMKRIDMAKTVLPNNPKAIGPLLDEAKKYLNDVFGMDVVELDTKSKSYILVSRVDNSNGYVHQIWGPEESSKIGLVMVILALIFMNGNIMKEADLYTALKKLYLDIETKHHVFGDLKKLLTQEFVRLGYLQYTRQHGSDPPVYDFTWGSRARAETTKMKVLQMVSKIYDVTPDSWGSQYSDAVREQGEG